MSYLSQQDAADGQDVKPIKPFTRQFTYFGYLKDTDDVLSNLHYSHLNTIIDIIRRGFVEIDEYREKRNEFYARAAGDLEERPVYKPTELSLQPSGALCR